MSKYYNTFNNWNCLDSAGNKLKLTGKDGNPMFVCHTEDELNLDEFETDVDYDESQSTVAFDIQNLAANFIGEHECVFSEVPQGFKSEHLKLMVTTDANVLNQVSAKTEFKAEILIERDVTDNTQTDDDIYINCPKSGMGLERISIIKQ